MEKQGLVRKSKSPWASPIVVIDKEEKFRVTDDYRKLNLQTKPDRHPAPTIYDSIQKIRKDIQKTAIISPAGFLEYCRMPFGLHNSPATWHRFISAILADLPCVFLYYDDILIFSDTKEQQYEYIEAVFKRLAENGLTIISSKCEFVVSEIDFLGYKITANGFLPTDKRTQEIREMKRPTTILRSSDQHWEYSIPTEISKRKQLTYWRH